MLTTLHNIDAKTDLESRLEDGLRIRQNQFNDKWQFDGYEEYPTKHDKIDGTTILIFSEENSSGEDVVFGTRRICTCDKK